MAIQEHNVSFITLSHPPRPNSEKLVLYISAREYSGNKPQKPYALLKSGANFVMYDVY